MAIGINYTHLENDGRKILPNYVYVLTNTSQIFRDIRYNQLHLEWKRERLLQEVCSGRLHSILEDGSNKYLFDNDIVRQLLFASYDYEIHGKYLGEETPLQVDKADKIIELFNQLYQIDYHQTMGDYQAIRNHQPILLQRSNHVRTLTYDSLDEAVDLFIHFVEHILSSQGYEKEAKALMSFMRTKLVVRENKEISAVTLELGTHMEVQVGSNLSVVLFHELTHVVNNFFRYRYIPQTYEHRKKDWTKENEGFANLIGYNFVECIEQGGTNVGVVPDHMVCYSPFIEVYARLQESGSADIGWNRKIIEETMKEYDDRDRDETKLSFYTDRFYKFFPYNQHQYFYPKELLYHIGYAGILEQFRSSRDKRKFLANGLLGGIII